MISRRLHQSLMRAAMAFHWELSMLRSRVSGCIWHISRFVNRGGGGEQRRAKGREIVCRVRRGVKSEINKARARRHNQISTQPDDRCSLHSAV